MAKVVIQVLVEAAEKAKIAEIAEKEGIGMSAVARQLIRRSLEDR